MYERFINLCKMTQPQIKKHVTNQLLKTHPKVIVENGFVFAEGKFPVLLVAHLDTVHALLPNKIIRNKDILSSPQGIGGDDRCGVYMILSVLQRFNCSVLFCEDEEIGCVGATKFTKFEFPEEVNLDFNYIIEFDRKNSNDAVFYDCANKEFEAFITQDFYKTAPGIYSDISIIAPYLERAAVNLSCGYYNPHTNAEYVNMTEMEASIDACCDILARTNLNEFFEYVEDRTINDQWDFDWTPDSYSEEKLIYIIEYATKGGEMSCEAVIAYSDAEAIGKFLMDHPSHCFNDIYDFFPENI